MQKVTQDDVMWFLTMVRFDAIESMLEKLNPSFEEEYSQAYQKSLKEGLDRSPEFKALIDKHNQEKENSDG